MSIVDGCSVLEGGCMKLIAVVAALTVTDVIFLN